MEDNMVQLTVFSQREIKCRKILPQTFRSRLSKSTNIS